MNKIENIIKTIKESDGYIPMIYMQGGCYQFYKVLKSIFPTSEAYMIKMDEADYHNHIITKIETCYYDINGKFDIDKYSPVLADDRFIERKFSGNHVIVKECSDCGNEIEFYCSDYS